ncbi:hypothetical protein SBOR_3195 [Sclerotinia borealis F-4128]|uniref:Extracellular membrane protein CFEM domain-containing protein n=1 Tax=Sclerotinia borealis (strain F-4128) TaxID=1432307 RepID=W9CKE6_SCLBF|nr:hypothetical protein SBOR_3195 [Sclerotinia borealis F-4128]
MRPIIFSLLVSSATIGSAYKSLMSDGCGQGNFHDLVIRNSCADDLSIVKCLAEDVDLRQLDQIKQCFIAGGCDAIDSTISAVWFSYECNDRQGPVEEAMKEDLRKRATETSSTSESTTESTTSEASTATSSTSTSASTTVATTTTSASTTASAAASSTTATSSSSTITGASASTTTASTTSLTSATTTSATSSSTGTSLVCSTTSYYSTSVCSYGTGASTGVTLGCVTTSAAFTICAEGVLCTTATSGDDVFVGFKDRQAAKTMQAEHIALLDVESKQAMQSHNQKRSKSIRQPDAFGYSESNLPLISEPGQEQGYSNQAPQTITNAPPRRN